MPPWTAFTLIPVTGPWWPSYVSVMPALAPCLHAEYAAPSSLPTTKLFTSECGKSRQVTATGFDCIRCRSSVSWGWPSMSSDQEHSRPSVEMLIKLCAFWVPTTLMQYTGCCRRKRKTKKSLPGCRESRISPCARTPTAVSSVWAFSSGRGCPTGRSVPSRCPPG